MARKKPQLTSDEILAMMHPDLPTSDDNQPAATTAKTPTAEEQIAALSAQVAQLTGQLSARPTVVQSAPVEQRQTRQAPTAPTINYAAMPDPIRDPVGYTAFVQSQVATQVQYEKDLYNFQQQEATQSKVRTDNIWNDFTRSHGAYAENERRIEIATTQVLQRVAAGGGNTDAFMANRTGFFDAITSEYDELFGKPAGDANDDDNDDAGDDGDDNRSQVFGGSAAGPKGPGETVKPAPEKYGALGQEIKSWQEKTGFYR